MIANTIGTRMKENYEFPARHTLTRRTPVIIRVDGKAFHTFTRGVKKPFDQNLINAMVIAAENTAAKMQGFKIGYVQSDEASFLLTDFDQLDTQAWYGNVQSKLESITASLFTAHFNQVVQADWPGIHQLALFDARAFNIPVDEVTNYFVWRALDWQRNSVSMYAQANFSQKELNGKSQADMHEMLFMKGYNWATDLGAQLKNGTFLTRDRMPDCHVLPNYAAINAIVSPYLQPGTDVV